MGKTKMPVRRKKRSTTRRTTKRRATTKKPKRKSTRKSTKAPSEAERQLAVYHNPFSLATKQPKIPDGKITESLGFQTQAVGELSGCNADSDPVVPSGLPTNGVMHVLLYPGQDAGMLVYGDLAGAYPNGDIISGDQFNSNLAKANCIGFAGSNGFNWNPIASSGDASGTLTKDEAYAAWRVVSTGLRLNLLNPAEEDDGWWEAVRLTEPMRTTDYAIYNRDNSTSTTQGTITPLEILYNKIGSNITNEQSYTTGLLRNLGAHTFACHPIMDQHDVQQQPLAHLVETGDVESRSTTLANGFYATLADGRPRLQSFINSVIDPSYDMVYIRIHGRPTGAATRLHYNVVSNQEIAFSANEKEARFHTRTTNVGPAMSLHSSAKRGSGSASHVVSMS
ncbi:MAG: capsid protein [Avonheates virus SG_924]|uniref:capsid protein n=1 Tax=Avonheates virus SG_924 TaxID=2914488 RepID=UPI002481A642|nr:MAG: capsid protein [Avonheates virus SG_924]UNI72606.1 MAG: capsid protein [Avonheates virus SG_924]